MRDEYSFEQQEQIREVSVQLLKSLKFAITRLEALGEQGMILDLLRSSVRLAES